MIETTDGWNLWEGGRCTSIVHICGKPPLSIATGGCFHDCYVASVVTDDVTSIVIPPNPRPNPMVVTTLRMMSLMMSSWSWFPHSNHLFTLLFTWLLCVTSLMASSWSWFPHSNHCLHYCLHGCYAWCVTSSSVTSSWSWFPHVTPTSNPHDTSHTGGLRSGEELISFWESRS